MSKRNRNASPSFEGGRARSAPVKVSKPFPWGTVLISIVLAALLIGIVAYAAVNQGSGVRDLLAEDDESFPNLITLEEPARDHVDGPVDYPDYPARPPAGGAHNALPQTCQVYEEQIPAEHAVHSLEHGAVWVTYSPDLDDEQVQALADEVEGDTHRMLSPLPGQESPIVATAWGRQLEVDSADDDQLGRFLEVYTNGRQTPERGAACVGNTATGTAPVGAAPTDPGFMPEPLPEGEEVDPETDQAPVGEVPEPQPTG